LKLIQSGVVELKRPTSEQFDTNTTPGVTVTMSFELLVMFPNSTAVSSSST
jgi:hypothetical protein